MVIFMDMQIFQQNMFDYQRVPPSFLASFSLRKTMDKPTLFWDVTSPFYHLFAGKTMAFFRMENNKSMVI